MKGKKQPNPGSQKAIDLGCTCPIMDNNHGQGILTKRGTVLFWYTEGCPIHNPISKLAKPRFKAAPSLKKKK